MSGLLVVPPSAWQGAGMENVAVRAATAEDEHTPIVMVTLEGMSWSINIWAKPDDWSRLAEVPASDWDKRQAVRLGKTEGSQVWWHASKDALFLSVGDRGPEASDFGLVMPLSVLSQVRIAVANADEGWG
jgi:hypothetical protein